LECVHEHCAYLHGLSYLSAAIVSTRHFVNAGRSSGLRLLTNVFEEPRGRGVRLRLSIAFRGSTTRHVPRLTAVVVPNRVATQSCGTACRTEVWRRRASVQHVQSLPKGTDMYIGIGTVVLILIILLLIGVLR
jgi:hypothetical protein